MKRSMVAACALGFGLLASIDGVQIANAMPSVPDGAAAAAQTSPVTQVWFRGGGWRGGWRGGRPGYWWRPGYGWVPFAVAGAVIAGAAAASAYPYYGPGPYYSAPYGPPPPGYYGPGPGGPGPGPDYGPPK